MKIRVDNETKREKFLRLATQRTRIILQKIRILGNCSNKQVYDYTDDDIQKIFSAIEKELKVSKSKFGTSRKMEFDLE